MRFHDLRHSYATWMLAENVNPKIVSSVLGHANVGITLDIYSHPNVSMQAACLDAMHRQNKKTE
jgi:integrase